MAGRVGYALCRRARPACTRLGLTEEACFDTGAVLAFLYKALAAAENLALDRVTDTVVEGTDASVELLEVILVCHHGSCVGVGFHVPCFAVHDDLLAAAVLIKSVERVAD